MTQRAGNTPWIAVAGFAAVLASGLVLGLAPPTAYGAGTRESAMIAAGKKLAFDRQKGNCLACHVIAGGEYPGNIGPPLVNMKQRYPDIAKLRAQIWDATVNHPTTVMPPFGRNKILTGKEIDEVAAFIQSL
ncbi:MAG: sulfur oxidation c-type cytochrome SoxX [Chromatiales bacterium 21-64-14]|nr:MAG: sulfur oxidation c-type cytochrome SoxX [Chromatiales bacterium 21-64-14]